MDIGTGIIIGCSILSAVAVVFKIIDSSPRKKKNNPNSKYLLADTFLEYKEGINTQLATLTKSVSELRESIRRSNARINGVLGDKH